MSCTFSFPLDKTAELASLVTSADVVAGDAAGAPSLVYCYKLLHRVRCRWLQMQQQHRELMGKANGKKRIVLTEGVTV